MPTPTGGRTGAQTKVPLEVGQGELASVELGEELQHRAWDRVELVGREARRRGGVRRDAYLLEEMREGRSPPSRATLAAESLASEPPLHPPTPWDDLNRARFIWWLYTSQPDVTETGWVQVTSAWQVRHDPAVVPPSTDLCPVSHRT